MLGDHLKIFRKEKGLTLKALATAISSSPGFISEVENNMKLPGSEFLISLKRVYNIDLNWLLSDGQKPAVSEPDTGYAPDNDLREILQRILEEADQTKKNVLRSMLVALDPGKKARKVG